MNRKNGLHRKEDQDGEQGKEFGKRADGDYDDDIREMVDSNSVIGEPITTPDGVTLIPVSRVSLGFGSGGGTYGQTSERFGGGGGAGVKIDPVAFLVIKDGQTRMMPVAVPATATMDRVLEMAPQLIDRVEGFVNKKKEEKEFV